MKRIHPQQPRLHTSSIRAANATSACTYTQSSRKFKSSPHRTSRNPPCPATPRNKFSANNRYSYSTLTALLDLGQG
eukprot:6192326-Pleurochrysis_carterae.AAC.1